MLALSLSKVSRMKRNKSRYLSLYERVRDDIVAGVYPHSKKLPSKRTMADNYNVSVITVEHAYELLEEEGYISSVEKKGYFVIYDPVSQFPVSNVQSGFLSIDNHITEKNIANNKQLWSEGPVASEANEKIKELDKKETEVFQEDGKEKGSSKIQAGSGDGLSFAQYARTARRVLSAYGERILERAPGFGCENLRKAIASYLSRCRRVQVAPERIIIGSGAEYLYGLIIKVLGHRITYGIESPSYRKIAFIYESEGAKTEALSLSSDGIASNELWNADIQVLHITPYRSYPSGVTASASKKHEYLKWSSEKNAIIIEDDFESEFSPSRKPEETVFFLSKGKNVIYVNTFTRTIGSFLRVAYMVVPEDMLEQFERKVGFMACTVPTPEQYIIAELLENGEFERHINRVRRKKREDRKK